MTLPPSFLARPIAHRALHDIKASRPENSPAAVRAAVEAGYGIEIDLQISADGVAMVFHDYALKRLTGARGKVSERTADALGSLTLLGGADGIPTLAEVLALVDGRVPLLIEVKDQDGALGPNVGPLEEATAKALDGYAGDVAVMSFNPHSVARMAALMPDVPRGLTTEDFVAVPEWGADAAEKVRLARIEDYRWVGACFISHNHKHLGMDRVAELKSEGAVVLCWTIRSPEQEAKARRIADNVTFEGYLA